MWLPLLYFELPFFRSILVCEYGRGVYCYLEHSPRDPGFLCADNDKFALVVV